MHNRKNISKFVSEILSFEIADAHQSLIAPCFAAVAINRARTFARMLHDDYDIAVIYIMKHCPGALLASILTSNKTWRTRNTVRSSNGDCEKTTQHFAMMSASEFFVGYMRSSMAS